MKVLWFTNSPVSAAKKLVGDFVGESWIGALENKITQEKNIELCIAFNSNVDSIVNHLINNVSYYLLPRSSGRKKRKLGFGYYYNFDDKNALKDYLKVIDVFRPDIIHIFGSENNFGLVIPHIEVPVIIHIQGNITAINHKYFSGISRVELLKYSRIKDIIRGTSLLHQARIFRIMGTRETVIYSNCNYFFGRTRWDQSIASVFSPGSVYYHCDELLRKEFYKAKWSNVISEKLKLVSVLRGGIYKGLDTVMEAATVLSKLGLKFEWIIIGDSVKNKVPKIFERKYHSTFSSVNVKFVGNKNVDQLIDLLSNSSLFIHPSHIENSPNAVCEAMMLGIPIVATSVGGTNSIVTNNVEGLLIQDGDPYAMAGAILELKNDRLLQNELSVNARNRALIRHDPDKIVMDLKKIYSDVITDFKSKRESKTI